MANLKTVAKNYAKHVISIDAEYLEENTFTSLLDSHEYKKFLADIRATKNFKDIQKEFAYDEEDEEAEEDAIIDYVQKIVDEMLKA